MRISSRRNHMIDFLFPVALLFVFAVSAMIVILFAAGSYEDTVAASSRSDSARTSLAYVTEKVHQNDENGGARLGDFDGHEALIMEQRVDGEDYVTYIYCIDGFVKELFTSKDSDVRAGSGTSILEVKDFDIEKYGEGLLRLTCTDSKGNKATTIVGTRSR